MKIDSILSRLTKVRKSGQGWTACCPAHPDQNQSLSFRVTDTGRLLAHCFAGCHFSEILESLGLKGERFTPAPRQIAEGPTPEQIEAKTKAIRLWLNSRPANPVHPYFSRKQIKPHQSRQIADSLIIPLQNSRGELWNLQFIKEDGTKRFLRGGMTKAMFAILGDHTEAERIYVSEGFATAATIHELTGKPVFVAFSANNLPSVSGIVRKAFPEAEIILAADADEAGERYSEQAARAIGGMIAYAGRAC